MILVTQYLKLPIKQCLFCTLNIFMCSTKVRGYKQNSFARCVIVLSMWTLCRSTRYPVFRNCYGHFQCRHPFFFKTTIDTNTKINQHYVMTYNSCLEYKTVLSVQKNQSMNGVWRRGRYLLWESCSSHKYGMQANCRAYGLTIYLAVYIFTNWI